MNLVVFRKLIEDQLNYQMAVNDMLTKLAEQDSLLDRKIWKLVGTIIWNKIDCMPIRLQLEHFDTVFNI